MRHLRSLSFFVGRPKPLKTIIDFQTTILEHVTSSLEVVLHGFVIYQAYVRWPSQHFLEIDPSLTTVAPRDDEMSDTCPK